jgi:hypothetical protein
MSRSYCVGWFTWSIAGLLWIRRPRKQKTLREAFEGPADELKKLLGFNDKRKLLISKLRGELVDNRWLDEPAAATGCGVWAFAKMSRGRGGKNVDIVPFRATSS